MKINRLYVFVSLLLFAGLAACKKGSDESSVGSGIVGTWQSASPMSPQGKIVYTYVLNADHSYMYSMYLYGVYAGQGLQDSSATGVYRGKYSVVDSKLSVTPASLVSWDKFYSSPPQTTLLSNKTNVNDFSIAGDTLTLSYITYPADAPVATTMKFVRIH